jgi:hypothetical protein
MVGHPSQSSIITLGMRIVWPFFCLGMLYRSPMVNDIADALYWLQGINAPLMLRCTYNVLAKNLLHICIVDKLPIHPLVEHFKLAKMASYVMFQTYFGISDADCLELVTEYIQSRYSSSKISTVPFKIFLIDLLQVSDILLLLLFFFTLTYIKFTLYLLSCMTGG